MRISLKIVLILIIIAAALAPQVFAAEGKLYVTCNVEGAKVKINGKEAGAAGEVIRGAPAGAVVLEVEAEGYAPCKQEVFVEESVINKVHVELKGMPVKVDIITEPDGATVYIDGKKQKEKTPCTIETTGGKHEIVLVKEGCADAVFKDRVLKDGDVIDAKLEKGESKYVSPEDKAKLAEIEERAKKGIYRCDFDTKELPEWLKLVTTGEGEGRAGDGMYVLDFPHINSTAVLQFVTKKGFPWVRQFSAKVRFRFHLEDVPLDFGIMRLDSERRAPKSIEGESSKRGSFRWILFFVPPTSPVQLLPYAVAPGGGWDGAAKAGFNMTVVGTYSGIKTEEFMSVEIQSDGRQMTYVYYDQHDKPSAKYGPISLGTCIKKHGRKKYWLSFGDLNGKATNGRMEIDYIEVTIPKTKKRR
ncbi:MAG: PEGA domain-containing protein [Planctomycetota bacterium]|jgi:hypothetical protein